MVSPQNKRLATIDDVALKNNVRATNIEFDEGVKGYVSNEAESAAAAMTEALAAADARRARSSREGFADSPSSVQREDVVEIDDHDDDDDDDDDGQNEVANYNLMVFSSLAARRRRSGI